MAGEAIVPKFAVQIIEENIHYFTKVFDAKDEETAKDMAYADENWKDSDAGWTEDSGGNCETYIHNVIEVEE